MTKNVLSQSKKKQDNIHRIPCPFCKELIIAGAKKCRFCKEDLSKAGKIAEQKQNFFTRKIAPSGPYAFWVLSMVAFLIAISQLSGDPNSRWIIVMFVAIAIGFIAFLTLIASIPRSKGKYGIITLLTFILFFGVLFNYDTIAIAFGLNPTFSKSNVGDTNTILEPATTTTSTPTPTPTKRLTQEKNVNSVQTNKVQCIGPDGKQFDTSMEECKNLNEKWGKPVNYILDCNIHPDCGGGVVRMSKSQCESPCSGLKNNGLIDCHVANRVFRLSKNECDELVKKANKPLNDANSDNADWANLQKEIEQGRLQREAEYLKNMDQAIKSNDSMYKSCIASADGAKTRKISWCNSYQMGESYKESCKREAEATYLQAVGNCKSQYY